MKTLVLSLVTLILAVGSAFAQNSAFAPYVDAGIGISSTFNGGPTVTASNPQYVVGAGIESSTKHLLLDVNGQFNSGNIRNFINSNTSAFTGTATGTGYLKFGSFLLGGGVLYQDSVIDGNFYQVKSVQPTSAITFVPLVGGGYQFSRDRVLVNYELPGRSADDQRTFLVHNEIYLTKSAHLRFTQDISFNSSVQTANLFPLTERVGGGTGSVGLKLVF